MRTKSRRAEVIGPEGSDGTIDRAGQTSRIANAEMGARPDEKPAVRTDRVHRRAPPGRTANRAEIRPSAHILRELQMDLAGAGMSPFRNKSNRLPFR
jgi:hypothetical protein